MSTKRTTFTADFKAKVVLDVLKNDKTISEISVQYNVSTKNIQNWKKTFIANAALALDSDKAADKYKGEIKVLKSSVDDYAKKVGQLIIEKEWLEGKLVSLGSSTRQAMVEFKQSKLSIVKQCKLLGINRSFKYYNPVINEDKIAIKNHLKKVHEDTSIYGSLKAHQQLLEDGFKISPNTVRKYRQELGIKAVLAVKAPNTSAPCKEHKVYKYHLRGMAITRPNQVWSTDITYIRLSTGMVYLAAIIDWYSKAVLSWSISNTMDSSLVMGVLSEALNNFGSPEIFNTDQGSQYTSNAHTALLASKGITISMDGKGRATDNICIERFWRSAKCERIYLNQYKSMSELKIDVKDYIQFYNYNRFHQTLNYQKPMDVYKKELQVLNRNEDRVLKAA